MTPFSQEKSAAVWVIVANVKGHHRVLRTGARVEVTRMWSGGGLERVEVRGLSRGGRRVNIWINAKRLRNVRVGWSNQHLALRFDRAEAERYAEILRFRVDSTDAQPTGTCSMAPQRRGPDARSKDETS